MHVVIAVLLLLFVTALSSLFSRVVRLPLPLLQVALGVIANLLGLDVEFAPATFMLLFIPPLLFSDAYLTPMREFRELRQVILMLAFGLVVFTTFGGGYFINWLIAPLPLAAAFALAAVLSPTDAVAVGGMVQGRPAPYRFMRIMSGEALLNDASGLVCFNFAVAAAMTGKFSLPHAATTFVFVAAVGLVVGAVLGTGLALAERWLVRHQADDASIFVIFTGLLPFAAYLVADHLHASGILAAVAAGLTMQQGRVAGMMRSETRLRANSAWGILTFAFNGIIFLLLGLQLPSIVRSGIQLTHSAGVSPWLLLVAVIAITAALLVLRLVWLTTSLVVGALSARLRRRRVQRPPPRIVFAMSVAGVRGAITLAAVLSLDPAFPQRGLLVTLAAGVIVCSLLVAAVALPWLLSGVRMPAMDPMAREVELARLAMTRAAVAMVEKEEASADGPPDQKAEREEVLTRILSELRGSIRQMLLSQDPADGGLDEEERTRARVTLRQQRLETALRLRALRAERETLARMRKSLEINDETERLLIRDLDYVEQVLLATARALPRREDAPRS